MGLRGMGVDVCRNGGDTCVEACRTPKARAARGQATGATAGKVELAAMKNVVTLRITMLVTKLAAIGFNMMVVVSSMILIKHSIPVDPYK